MGFLDHNAVMHTPALAATQRVLFITRKWGPAVGGMETYCERLSQELAQLCAIDVVALAGRRDGSPPNLLSLLLFPLTVLRRLFAQRQAPSIIHLGDMAIWPLGLLALAFFPKAQLVLSAHGTDVAFGARGGVKGGLYARYLALGAAWLRGAKVVANSRATQQRLHAIGWPCEAVVPLATDLRAPDVRAGAPRSIDKRRIVFAGRLVTRKGLGWFVREVLPQLPRDIRVSVVGTRWDKSEESALTHPQVEFLGPLPQVQLAAHFAKAACVIVPNIEPDNGEYEGFGLVAPEAASSGGVVLASASGGLCDAVIDGETGFLIEAGNAKAWAEKITQTLDWNADERAQFLAHSQTLSQSHYAWPRVAAQTLEAYAR